MGPQRAFSPLLAVLLVAASAAVSAETAPVEGRPSREDGPGARSWAFTPPAAVVPPRVETAAHFPARNALDAFIARAQQRRGLTPAGPTDRRTLLRRVWLDLVGLPPSPADVERFLADASPDALERVVDSLLASPRYGERWARHWMDVWRYSDWYGWQKELRNSQRHMWRWRDWIVDSLNEDRGYDRMVLEMLAGDELAPDDPETLRATGFLARNYYKFNRDTWLDDTIEHTAKAFLGVTMNCARCHEHKYDPITQEDYYRFRAFFEPHRVRVDRLPGEPDVAKQGVARAYDAELDAPTYVYEAGNDKRPLKDRPLAPGLPAVLRAEPLEIRSVAVPVTAYYPALREFERRESLDAAREQLAAAEKALAEAGDRELALRKLETARARLASLEARGAAETARLLPAEGQGDAETLALKASAAERRLALAVAEETLHAAHVARGDAAAALDGASDETREAAQKKLATAEKAVAAVSEKADAARKALADIASSCTPLGERYPTESSGRRLALARWIASGDNPLTARVAVNHIWLRHFGAPLVASVFDFGLNGEAPTHPELLDWLARRFIESGWSMKDLHRLIVTSSTYRLASSDASASELNAGADPDNRFLWRMNGRRLEAEAVRDSVLAVCGQLDGALGGPELAEGLGETTYRRSLYYRHAHEKYMRFLQIFDSPNVFECYKRDETVVPQQALALANSRLAMEQARRLARELSEREGATAAAFVDTAFERILGRPATDEERGECLSFLDEQMALLASTDGLEAFTSGGRAELEPSDDAAQRAREDLVHALLNHSDFVVIR